MLAIKMICNGAFNCENGNCYIAGVVYETDI
jgi:hypothetical protein